MFSVDQIDISGVHALESIVRTIRERGGDLFIVRVQTKIFDLMKSTAFYDYLGEDHFLSYNAIDYLFYRVLDPAICIYECEARVFKECQNLPRPVKHPVEISLQMVIPEGEIEVVEPLELWRQLHKPDPPMIIDVREPREFTRGHIVEAQSIPLFRLLSDPTQIPKDQLVILVCRSGRRSTRATYLLNQQGFDNIRVVKGGMLAWEAAGLIEAVES
jgi:SulP family sulfate permease